MYRLLSFYTLFFMLTCMSVCARADTIEAKLAALEAAFDGKIGVAAIHTQNKMRIQYRADTLFPMQSTFKVMAVAAILQNTHFLQEKLRYTEKDLVSWSPITEKHLADGMTIADLSFAAIAYSDNTAINLLVKKLGGVEAVNVFARSIGDKTFRLDSWEPNLNSDPKKMQDSSTPLAMEKSLHALLFRNALSPSEQAQLLAWMKQNTTGEKRVRAGVPKTWKVADKTGSGKYGIVNDISVLLPPQCAPIVVAIYFVGNKKEAVRHEEVIASAIRILVDAFAQTDACIKHSLSMR